MPKGINRVDLMAVIDQQFTKIAGLRMQMAQMQRGYERKLRRLQQTYKARQVEAMLGNMPDRAARVAWRRSGGNVAASVQQLSNPSKPGISGSGNP